MNTFPHFYLWLAIAGQSLGLLGLGIYVLLMRFRANSRLTYFVERLGHVEDSIESHGALHRSHTKRLADHDAEIAFARAEARLLRQSTGGLWRTAIGTLVQIRQMSDDHLENSRLHLIQTGRASIDTYKLITDEQKRRRYDRRMTEHSTRLREAADQIEAATGIRPNTVVAGEAVAGCIPSVIQDRDVQIEAKGPAMAKVITDPREIVNPHIDFHEVDKILSDLVGRTVLSRGINTDLQRLQHLLARGRAGR